MLHVTNGSVALSRLHALGVPGEIVPWDDVLHEGPVPASLPDAELRHLRAQFLAGSRDETAQVERSLEARDGQLRSAATGDEIVLWFEHDLYDQLHVLQVLDQLTRMGSSRTARVTAILADDYLTAQPDERLQAWFDTRRELTAAQWQAAAAAWIAFRAPDPTSMVSFDHAGVWPTLRAALRRHLQQFPSVHNGLSRSEQQTLNALTGGPLSPRAAFGAANYEVEEAIFMGDLGWWYHIRTLITGRCPLVAVIGEAPASFSDPEWWRDEDGVPVLALTDDGRRVLAGEADRIALNGLDRWLGGVHLVATAEGNRESATANRQSPDVTRPTVLWRWDDSRERLLRT
jgi:hypothetical protein